MKNYDYPAISFHKGIDDHFATWHQQWPNLHKTLYHLRPSHENENVFVITSNNATNGSRWCLEASHGFANTGLVMQWYHTKVHSVQQLHMVGPPFGRVCYYYSLYAPYSATQRCAKLYNCRKVHAVWYLHKGLAMSELATSDITYGGTKSCNPTKAHAVWPHQTIGIIDAFRCLVASHCWQACAPWNSPQMHLCY